jgi:hypothetical protein
MLLNVGLNWALKMLQVMCYYQTSMLLPAATATGTFENVEQQRKEKGLKKPQ